LTLFEARSRLDLEASLAAHVGRHFSPAALGLANDDLEAGIAQAVDRALEHGFAARDDVFSFVSLACALGPDFDRDPGLPWVLPHLRSGQRPEVRMADLCTAAIEHLQAVPTT
jgi:hypothetical protein